jgi:hypothetical protein
VYGTYDDFKARGGGSALPLLAEEPVLHKLKQLSIVTLASSRKSMRYDELMARLDIGSKAELERLLIGATGAGLLQVGGRCPRRQFARAGAACVRALLLSLHSLRTAQALLDQRASTVTITSVAGRDVHASQVGQLKAKLEAWCVPLRTEATMTT